MPRGAIAVALVLAAGVFLWAFPPIRIARLTTAASSGTANVTPATFDPAVVAAKLWSGDLRDAAQRAPDASVVAAAIRENPEAARRKHARSVGMGAAYYFVRGSGKVVAADRSAIRVALGDTPSTVVALRVGPIFGNAVRDGTGLIDVNQAPGLHEFNALSAELNKLVETELLPVLREKATVGSTITFAGCAEAAEDLPPADKPFFTLIPVLAEVRADG